MGKRVPMPQPKKYSTETIVRALRSSSSLSQALGKLGTTAEATLIARALDSTEIGEAYKACKARGVASRHGPRKTTKTEKDPTDTKVVLRHHIAQTNKLLERQNQILSEILEAILRQSTSPPIPPLPLTSRVVGQIEEPLVTP